LIHTNNKEKFSFFDTEKYGTMTIIPKDQSDTTIQYEITPFRTETTYSDGRHPDEVVRSDSLLEDSQRRDFTINCMYYTIL
jgi:tRNA nucleotidyltransferase/poly(A) polymerase